MKKTVCGILTMLAAAASAGNAANPVVLKAAPTERLRMLPGEPCRGLWPATGRHILVRDFWSPSLALGVYRRSRCVFGIEMHSQVMALGSGVPACVFRHSGFGSKSGMLADLGVGEWCLDIDEPHAREKAVRMVGDILAKPTESMVKCRRLRARIDSLRFRQVTPSRQRVLHGASRTDGCEMEQMGRD